MPRGNYLDREIPELMPLATRDTADNADHASADMPGIADLIVTTD